MNDVIILFNEKKLTYEVILIPAEALGNTYHVASGLKTPEAANEVKKAYVLGFYDGKNSKEKKG